MILNYFDPSSSEIDSQLNQLGYTSISSPTPWPSVFKKKHITINLWGDSEAIIANRIPQVDFDAMMHVFYGPKFDEFANKDAIAMIRHGESIPGRITTRFSGNYSPSDIAQDLDKYSESSMAKSSVAKNIDIMQITRDMVKGQ